VLPAPAKSAYYPDRLLGGERYAVSVGFIASLIIVILAVLSVFIEIQVVSNYAFWFVVGAHIILAGSCFD
jgi:hypothetical protein